ncbi:MAG TPA: discoidin domain-containing protein, partial [Bryobacteraceae bacterium]|nr:discoidin domain-containing protein [Bryobacteraceae bacterium]
TTRGLKTAGLLGPVFLLAPLSLLSLRSAAGRRLLLPALVFLLPYPANLGTRFLLPAATFVAPAIAIGLGGGTDRRLVLALKGFATWPWRAANPWRITPLSVRVWLGTGTVLALLVLVHAWLSWPSHIEWYAHHGAWRLTNVPIRAALRIQPEDEYIGNVLHEHFQMVRFIERATPPGSRIYSLGSLPEAYCSREILTSFYSASNERLRETLCAAIQGLLPPTRLVTFRISNQPLRRLRLVQTGSGGLSTPAVNEMRIFGPSGELRPGAGWRFYARPFPWDAGLAFDRNPTTRWSAWQEIREGAWIQVDFSKEETIAGVRLEAAPDQNLVQWVLQAETRPGRWSALPAAVEQTIVPAPPDLRGAATSQLKRQAIRYLFVEPSYPVEDFNDHAREWGIRPLVHYGAAWLYYLE